MKGDIKPTTEAEEAKPTQPKISVQGLGEKLSANAVLDLVFIMDATGSMGSYIASAQESIKSISEEIVATEKADVRFALVAYRDHPPQDSSYVTKVFPFTSSVSKMKASLDTISAQGGGDTPEAVADGLHDALKLDYRPQATKICVLIADAPPHGLGCSGDGFPNGCPLDLDPIKICRQMATEGITLYIIGCEPSITPYKAFFEGMATITGGQYCALQSAAALRSVIVGGAREEIALDRLMYDVSKEVSEMGGLGEEEQVSMIHKKMTERKTVVSKLKKGSSDLPSASPVGQKISTLYSMSDVRKEVKPSDIIAGPSPSSMLSHRMATPMKKASMTSSSKPSPPSPPMMMGMGRMGTAPVMDDDYLTAVEEVSMDQCRRMVQKSKARSSKLSD